MQGKKSIKNLILVLICAHDGEYTWYQLERELEWRGLAGKARAGDIAELLLRESFITQEIKTEMGAGLPVYHITDSGRKKAKEVVELYGLESFKIKKQNPNDYEL